MTNLKFIFSILLFFLIKGQVAAQTEEQLLKIEEDYNKFKSELSTIIGATENSEVNTKKFYGDFPHSLLEVKQVDHSIGISDPFCPPLEAVQQAIKRACFIQALKNGSKSFAVIDYYSKESNLSTQPLAVGFREMVHVFVDSIYDTENIEIVRHEYLKTGELILTVDFSKCKRSSTTAIFEIFKNSKELGNALQKTSQIKIINGSKDEEEDKTSYQMKKNYHAYEIKTRDVSVNENFADFYFSYTSYKTKFGIKGGLWSYIVLQLSENILEQASEKTKHVQSVTDNYLNNELVQITRMVGFFEYQFKYKSFILGLRNF